MNRYPGNLLFIEKFDSDKVFTALYYDGQVKSFYVKRFSFVLSDNTPLSFISDTPKSYLVDISSDKHPQYEISWKMEDKPAENVDAEEWIAKKGLTAKGKKCHDREIKKVEFIEPLHKPEDDVPAAGQSLTSQDIDLEIDTASGSVEDLPDLNIEEPTLF